MQRSKDSAWLELRRGGKARAEDWRVRAQSDGDGAYRLVVSQRVGRPRDLDCVCVYYYYFAM